MLTELQHSREAIYVCDIHITYILYTKVGT